MLLKLEKSAESRSGVCVCSEDLKYIKEKESRKLEIVATHSSHINGTHI